MRWLGLAKPVTWWACLVLSKDVYVTKAMPSLLRARTIEIWKDVEFCASMCAWVKTLCTAMVRLRPEASMLFIALFTEESRITCEHCRCELLMTND